MNKNKGFTLVEVLIVVVIIGVLMAYGIPSYQRYVIQSKRTEAKTTLMEIASEQEKHMAVYNQYATKINGTLSASELGLKGRFNNTDNYEYIISTNVAGLWTLRAVAKGNTQINDDFGGLNCKTLRINAIGTKTPLDCWQ